MFPYIKLMDKSEAVDIWPYGEANFGLRIQYEDKYVKVAFDNIEELGNALISCGVELNKLLDK